MCSLPFKLRSGLYLVCVAVCFFVGGEDSGSLQGQHFFFWVFVDGILPDGFVVLLKQTGDRRRF